MSKAVITVTGVDTEHVNAMREALESVGVHVTDMRIFPDNTRTKVVAR